MQETTPVQQGVLLMHIPLELDICTFLSLSCDACVLPRAGGDGKVDASLQKSHS